MQALIVDVLLTFTQGVNEKVCESLRKDEGMFV